MNTEICLINILLPQMLKCWNILFSLLIGKYTNAGKTRHVGKSKWQYYLRPSWHTHTHTQKYCHDCNI